MEILLISALILIVILVLIRYTIRYLDGDFTVEKSEIVREGRIINEYKENIGYYYDIKVTYRSGRIKVKYYKNI